MTLDQLYIEEPFIKEIFKKAENVERKEMKVLYSMISDWTFIDGFPLNPPSSDIKNIDKLNCFLKYIPDNSSSALFLGMIRLTFMKRELLEEWIPLVNRSYKILYERGEPELERTFVGLSEYIKDKKTI